MFDWPTVFAYSDGSSSRILEIIGYITFKPMAKNNYDVKLKNLAQVDWRGQSFILNPKPLFVHREKFLDKELAEYVALASFRNYNEYKVTKRKTLWDWESPIAPESLQNNRLLTFANNQFYFAWEEVTQ